MNIEDARKVAWIMSTADGGCSHCAGKLLEKFVTMFPELRIVADGFEVEPDEADEPVVFDASGRLWGSAFDELEVAER